MEKFKTFGWGPGSLEGLVKPPRRSQFQSCAQVEPRGNPLPDYEGELRTVGKPVIQAPTGLLTVLLNSTLRHWRGRFLDCEYCAIRPELGLEAKGLDARSQNSRIKAQNVFVLSG